MRRFMERYRYSFILLKQLVKTDFKLRYQGSVLGYTWSLLRPLALFIILYLVFAKIFNVGDSIPHFPVYLLSGIVLWNYFVEVTTGGVGAIVARGDLIRKINFPKYVIILAGSASALINLFLNFIIIGGLMAFNGIELSRYALLVPFLVLELFVFSLAMAFLLSTLYVKFRDVNYIWEVVLQAAFYATPILYPLSLVPEKYAQFLILNPMAQIIQDFRYVVITPETLTISHYYSGLMRWLPIVFVVLFAVFAAMYFRRRSKYFAEEV